MTSRGSSADADRSARQRQPRAGSLRRRGRAVAAALRRYGQERPSLTARLMGDPPPGRSALASRERSPAERPVNILSAEHEMSFAGPVELIDPADPYDEMDPAELTNSSALGD